MGSQTENKTGEEQSLEEIFASIDSIINDLQEQELSLEDTFAGYKKGVELVELAGKKIEKIECDIKILGQEEQAQ